MNECIIVNSFPRLNDSRWKHTYSHAFLFTWNWFILIYNLIKWIYKAYYFFVDLWIRQRKRAFRKRTVPRRIMMICRSGSQEKMAKSSPAFTGRTELTSRLWSEGIWLYPPHLQKRSKMLKVGPNLSWPDRCDATVKAAVSLAIFSWPSETKTTSLFVPKITYLVNGF